MPFTPCHAAAILPLLRTPLPASALVAGSIAPDLPFYLPVELPWPTHTAGAVVTVDVLLGLLAWVVWHALLSEPALAGAPAGLRARLAGVPLGLRNRLRPVRRLGWPVLAVALGAAVHVLWDEFTHADRWGTEHLPALAQTWGPLPGHRWLQHLSSLVGGAILLAWFVHWWRRRPARPGHDEPPARWAWALILSVGTAVGAAAALRQPSLGAAGVAGATWGGGAALAVSVVLAVGWHLVRRPRPAG